MPRPPIDSHAPISERHRRLVKLAAHQRLHLIDDDYRALLQRVAGVRSSKDLRQGDFDPLMREFERLGFVSSARAKQFGERIGFASQKQLTYMRSLWRRYNGRDDDDSLESWIERKFGTSHLRFLDTPTAGRVITALRNMVSWRKSHPRPSAKQRAQKAMSAAAQPLKTDDPPF